MRRIAVLPALVTLGNLFCGFAAIAYVVKAEAVPERFGVYMEWAGLLVLFALFFDALDGKVARITRTATDFGAQLDSLSDLVSFGVAPALMIKVLATRVEVLPHQVAWVTSTAFVICAALRLARFNVETDSSEESHRYFSGLPTPAGGGLVASLVVMHFNLQQDQELSKIAVHIQPFMDGLVQLLPVLGVVLGVLMISRVRYIHVMNRLLRGHEPFDYLVCVIFVVLFAMLTRPFSLPLIFTIYACSGVVGLLRAHPVHTAESAVESETDGSL